MMFTKLQLSRAKRSAMEDIPHFKGFKLYRLKDFLTEYVEGYDMVWDAKNKESPYEIICLVDTRVDTNHTMSDSRRKSLRRAGGAKRRRVKDRYHYENVFNRIHGYLLLEDQTKNANIPRGQKVLSLSMICSSYYTNMKGVGSFMMKSMVALAKLGGYSSIILEVSNEHAGSYEGVVVEEEEEEEEDEDDEYDGDDDAPDLESVNQPLSDRIGKEFIRKAMRVIDGIAYYNVGDDYIINIVSSYLDDEYDFESYDNDFRVVDISEPGENEYGGYFYNKGKRSQQGLQSFYEKFGFKEDSTVHSEWKAFTTDPYPSMILNL